MAQRIVIGWRALRVSHLLPRHMRGTFASQQAERTGGTPTLRARATWVWAMVALLLASSGAAEAQCSAGQVTITTAGATLANYTSAAPKTVTTVTVSIRNNSANTCDLALSFPSANVNQASMLNGASSLNYIIENAANNRIIFYSGATPASLTDRVNINNLAPGATRNVSVDVSAIPGQLVPGGIYQDLAMQAHVFNRASSTVLTLIGTASFPVSATVLSTCSISAAANTSQTIGVGPAGLTTGMTSASPTFNVTCSGASNVTLSSLNGAVTRGGVAEIALTPVPGFRNKIEYSAGIATGSSTHATLNTASASSVGPVVFGSSSISALGATVSITPETSAVPLVAGSYGDVLTITIAPQ